MKIVTGLISIAALSLLASSSFAIQVCQVGNPCPYKVYGLKDVTVDIHNIQPKTHYQCNFTVSGSNQNKVSVTNFADPDNLQYSINSYNGPNIGPLLINANNAVTPSDLYFSFHNGRFPWQSNQVSVTCEAVGQY